MQQFIYPVALTPEETDGGFVVTCRDIPEAITQGDTVEAALKDAEGALQAAIEARIGDGLDIPSPSTAEPGEHPVAVPMTTALKAALYLAMREQGVSKSELARRLGLNEKAARRFLNPRHTTKAPTLERALRALGKRVEVRVS